MSDETPRHGGISTFTVGVVALVVTLGRRLLRLHEGDPVPPALRGPGRVQDANNLRKASPVRIAGVNVGKVTKVERARKGDDGALVTMRIEDKGRPLHPDAHATIRPRIFLEGNFFVDLSRGTVGPGSATATRSRSTRPTRRSSSTRS